MNKKDSAFMPYGKAYFELLLLQKTELEIINILKRVDKNIKLKSYWCDKLKSIRKEISSFGDGNND
jgi:hypothetical protein